ncbi:MAG: cytochrome c oxidase assembly protein [Rubellimicrobium sp.]|nr:cytochrome c oxidase assembly protein [Rubellimicrobium sp.]
MNPFRRIANPNARLAAMMAALVAVMVSLSFLAVPLYSLFCRVTGYGGAPSVASAAPDHILDQTVTIRFDATRAPGMPWTFRPAQREMEIRLGESGLAFYEASNPTDHAVAGQASYNVTPYAAGGYFTKIECFCFTEQVLQPGETVLMPVSFYVDPAILDDPEGRYVHTITLSYTFYEIDLPDSGQQSGDGADLQQAALAAPAPSTDGPSLTQAAQTATQTN